MEDIIVTGIVGLCVSFFATAKIAQKAGARKVRKAEKAEQRARREKAEAFYDFLEVAAEARKENPENYQPGKVPGLGKDGIYLV